MPTASKVLIPCIVVLALGFIYLSTTVLEARRQWDLKVKEKAAEVAKVEQQIDLLANGSEDFQKDFKEIVAKPVLALASKAANDEYDKKIGEQYDARVAFLSAVNLFVDSKVIDAYQQAVHQLNEIQRTPQPDPVVHDSALKAYAAASRDFGLALKNLDDAYSIFLGQAGGQGGIRALAGKSMSIEAMKDTVAQIRHIIYAQRMIFNTALSDGEKVETEMKDRWQQMVFEANTLQQAAVNGQREVEEREKEIAQLEINKRRAEIELKEEEEKRDQTVAALDDLRTRFVAVTDRTRSLTEQVRDLEMRVDSKRGQKVVLTANGIVPRGQVLAVNEADGTLDVNLGTKLIVEPGVLLHVYRLQPEAKYLGLMEVIRSDENRAVGRMLPEYRQRIILPDDYVSPEITKETLDVRPARNGAATN